MNTLIKSSNILHGGTLKIAERGKFSLNIGRSFISFLLMQDQASDGCPKQHKEANNLFPFLSQIIYNINKLIRSLRWRFVAILTALAGGIELRRLVLLKLEVFGYNI